MEKIQINTYPPYTVTIGGGLIETAGEAVKVITGAQKLMVVSDQTVFALYGPHLLNSLRAQGFRCFSFVIPPGEASKNSSHLLDLWNSLAENGFSRPDAVVSLGGGVVSDLGGFAAATYMRGVDHLIFSTTLLSMADASVGGKTAIDLSAGKNLVGAFHAPRGVFCDISALSTLPESVLRDGMAEIIKCGMISSPELLLALQEAPVHEKLISAAINVKKALAEQDEKDVGARRLLNFGHTLAHAAETLSGGGITHGQAVAAGMYLMTAAAEKNGFCAPGTLKLLAALLKKYNLPTAFPFSLSNLCAAALCDKKRSGDALTLILPTEPGKAVCHGIPANSLLDFLSL